MYRFVTVVTAVIMIASGGFSFSLDGRIIGGRPANIEDYPYQLSFQFNGRHFCGATLIKPNVAVTAAHCTHRIKQKIPYLTVRAGSSLAGEGGQISKLNCICEHPMYDSEETDFDVAVLFLSESFRIGAGVLPISLQPLKQEISTGTMGTVTGWGVTEYTSSVSKELRQVKVPKVDHQECQDLYGYLVTNRMICFGFYAGGKDSCQGDSGGPLVVDGKLVGITSWGNECGRPMAPGVYTKISHPDITSLIHSCIDEFEKN